MKRLDVEFSSSGVTCRAWLYLPQSERPAPIVVMAHGFGGTREHRLAGFAERFCALGYASLVFDYRHFGASDGIPRQLLDVNLQLADWAAAIAFVRTRTDIDHSRIVLWGTSFSGGHVITTAARDHGISAAVAQNPFMDGLKSMSRMKPRPSMKVGALALADTIGSRLGRPPIMLGIVGEAGSGAMFTGPDANTALKVMTPENGVMINEVAARIAMQVMTYRPGRLAAQVACPLLVCVCDADSVCPPDVTVGYINSAAQASITHYPYGHFDIYEGEPLERVVAAQAEFLQRHVPVDQPGERNSRV